MDWLSPIRELFGFIFPFLERVPFIRAALGFILVFFLPGFAWTLVFFRRIKVLERILLSFALSIVVVTLSLLFANWILGLKVTGTSSVFVILMVTILPVVIYYLAGFVRRRSGEEEEKGEVIEEEDKEVVEGEEEVVEEVED